MLPPESSATAGPLPPPPRPATSAARAAAPAPSTTPFAPAAADRQHDQLGVGRLLGELEPDRALTGDHDLVLERVHERGAGLGRVGPSELERVLERVAAQLDAAAVRQRRLDLRRRRVAR